MGFQSRRAAAVFWKDFLDLRKNRGLMWTLLVFPTILVMVPAGIVFAYVRDASDASLRTMALFYDPNFPPSASAARYLIDRTLTDWFGLYLLMPVFVPILISSQSVAGEKEKRTIEPLLASPVSAAEIIIGKSLAAVVPAAVVSLAAFIIFCGLVDAASWRLLQEPLLPNGMWLFGVLVVAPLFAFFGNGVAVLVSARVADSRLAQQLSGLVTLPLIGLVGLQLANLIKAGTRYYAIEGAVVLLLDVLLVIAGIRLFDRDRLISRWV
jgi:ABC-2 type transport system permease protein